MTEPEITDPPPSEPPTLTRWGVPMRQLLAVCAAIGLLVVVVVVLIVAWAT